MEIIKKIILELKNPILSNSFFLLLDKVGKLGNFIAVLLIAKYYGISVFGEFSYAFAFASILGSFSDFGLKNVLIKYLVNDKISKNTLLGTSFLLIGIMSFFCVLVGCSYFLFSNESELIKRLILFFCVAYIFKPFYVIFYFYESKVEVKKIIPFLLFNTVVCLFLKSAAILNGFSLYYFGYITMMESLLEMLILTLIYSKNVSSLSKWVINIETLRKIFIESLPLFIATVMVIVYMRVDQIIIKKILNDSIVLGKYAISVKIIEACYIFPVVIIPTILPMLASKLKICKLEMLNFLKKGYQFLAAGSYVIFCILLIFSNHIIPTISKVDDELSSDILRILSITVFLVSFGTLQNTYFNIMNRNKMVLLLTTIGALSNILLNIFFVKKYGIVGSAYATVFSHLIPIIVPIFISKTDKNFSFMLYGLIKPSFRLN